MLASAIGIASASLVLAQPTADDHAAHHPDAAAAPRASAASAAPASPPAPAMQGMQPGAMPMDGMGMGCSGEGCGDGGADGLLSQLLNLKPGDETGRQRLAAESHKRMQDAAAVAAQAAKEAQWAASMRDVDTVQRARLRLREANAQFESGAAAHLALTRGSRAPEGAINWFKTQMSVSEPPHHGGLGLWLGPTPAHLILMTLLAMIAASLIGLQLLRRSRARSILAMSGPAAATQAPESHVTGRLPPASSEAALQDEPSPPPALPSRQSVVTGRPPSSRWSGLLRVAQIVRETPTISTFRLVAPDSERLPFGFAPGQFLQVETAPSEGVSAKRSYTIASSPTRSAYVELTVKREAQGVVSRFLHDAVKVGDLVKISGPFGVFTFNGTDADSIVLIAGGVGITPMMSVLRYLTDLAWPGDIFFIYSARAPEEVVFREEIEYLERRHSNVHVLVVVDARPPGTSWLGPEGRLTRSLIENEVPELGRRRIHLCGPPPMMAAMRTMLQELGVPDAQIRTEAFGPASLPAHDPPPEAAAPPPEIPAPSTPERQPEIAPATVTFSVAGVSAPMKRDTTILEAAEGAGVEIPYSCRVGVCGVCVVKLTQGAVTMEVEQGLDPADKAQGYVLACQAKCAGGDLVVEA